MKKNQYEITYLTDPRLSEEQRGSLHASVDEHITASEGSVVSSAPALRKTLAYPVHKQAAAFMRTMHIETKPETIDAIRTFLKKAEGVLRLTILATPARTRMSSELMEKHSRRKGKFAGNKSEKQHKEVERKPKSEKEVTMQDVEKGIEEALTEEVK